MARRNLRLRLVRVGGADWIQSNGYFSLGFQGLTSQLQTCRRRGQSTGAAAGCVVHSCADEGAGR
jgi:hypothetical protein